MGYVSCLPLLIRLPPSDIDGHFIERAPAWSVDLIRLWLDQTGSSMIENCL